MLASKDDFRNSITFLIPGIKLVGKQMPDAGCQLNYTGCLILDV